MNNKKKGILVIGYLPPPEEGTARITEIIVNSEFLKNNFRIHFLSLRKRNTAEKRGKLGVKNILDNALNICSFIYYVLCFKPDIIYTPIAQNKMGFIRDSVFVLLGRLFNKKICVHFHGGNFDEYYKSRSVIFQSYIKYVYSKIDRLILLAERIKSQFLPVISHEKMTASHNCIPSYPDLAIESKKQKNGVIRVLFTGYISKAKGALDLVMSIPDVISKYKGDIKFTFLGQPIDIERNITFIKEPHFAYSKIIKFIENNNLVKYIDLKGQVNTETKWKFMMDSDIFILPSYSEGMPMAVLEAMYCSLPMILTPVGAIPEALKDNVNCLFVHPGDIKNLSENILKLANSEKLRNEIGSNNKKLAETIFSQDNFVHSLSKIWNQLN